jgi:hypothetical protein
MTQPSDLMRAYWAALAARGDRPRTLYGMVSVGGEQPYGYVIGWSVSRKEIESRIAARGTPENWRIEEFIP